jgi:RNA polymerase sigma factor (sigma-70 family)
VLVHGILRGRRRKWHGETPHGDLPEPDAQEDVAGNVSVSRSVRTALGRLGLEQRQVVVLRYFADLSEAQIALVLGVARGTVKSRASRALAALSTDATLTDLLVTPHEEDR